MIILIIVITVIIMMIVTEIIITTLFTILITKIFIGNPKEKQTDYRNALKKCTNMWMLHAKSTTTR